MRVTLDGTLVPIDRPTLKAALDAAASIAAGKGRVLIAAEADGSPLPDAALESPSDEFSSILELKTTSAHPRDLVTQMLNSAADALEGLRVSQRDAGGKIRSASLESANQDLHAILAVWQAVTSALSHSAQILHADLSRMEVSTPFGSIVPNQAVDQLLSTLRRLQQCLPKQDFSALSDILIHDLDEHAQRWSAMLRAFTEAVATANR